MTFLFAPVEATMGVIQKVFYFHVPAAYAMYLSWGICTVASALYLKTRADRYDMAAKSAAEVSLLFAAIVMTTGPLWGRRAWGAYWTFDPRLTASLLFTLIIVAYLLIRVLSGGDRERRFAAALAILGAAVLPLIHLSVNKWRGQHPVLKRGGLEPSMRATLVVGFVTFTALSLLLIARRYALEKNRHRLAELLEEAAVRGDLEDAE
jgi:heme exporter protein C